MNVFNSVKCEAINIHSLRHLGDHIRSFGALFVFSAVAFESAHSFLGKLASDSHDFNQLICHRFLELRYLLNAELESDSIVFFEHRNGQ